MVTVAGAFEETTVAFDPMVEITPMQIVTISASMIAYSTAVGPSSFLMKLINAWVSFRTAPLPFRRAAHLGEIRQERPRNSR